MRDFLAIILPPLAILLCGKPFQALLNIILTMCFWLPGMIHALFVVHGHKADKRTERLEKAIRQNGVA
ncbi:YqaE/Pmp3 family membrane protein [Massilia sp. YIM B02769]|uniref:YqaE/Pmp3 family membrane protein n=1 Tax=Massilia sp. YIM B02769 TaxID=3050129 RepID=UPI0025B6727C|nr:YqaE/Pmp3 family membrane protein [Massilia sp. YIM B02769]MDN4059895.1 YqaE/Pmp3 family membrane protein [Massilia sp. YIM B02769]